MLSQKTKRWSCYFLVIVMTVLAVACGQTKTGANSLNQEEVQLKSALNTVKIMREEDIEALGDASNSGLAIEAARGETEGAQLVLRTNKDAEFDIQLSNLQNKAGEQIPASAVTVYVEGYLYTSAGYTGFAAGEYPDAMIPLEYCKSADENYTEAGKNQGLWFDITIPSEISAGHYEGTYLVTVGNIEIEVPVSVEVYNFDMPEIPYMKSTYLIWQDWLMDGELDNTIDKYEDYYDALLEYNLNAYYFPAEIGDVDGFIEGLRKYYDKVSSYGIPHENLSTTFEESNSYGGEAGVSYATINYEMLEEYLTAIAKACKEDDKNYFDKMYYYFDKVYDEITEERYPQMRACITTVNEIEAKVVKEQGLTGEVADNLNNAQHLMSVVDGWCEEFEAYEELRVSPLYQNFGNTKNIEMYEKLAAQGYSIESYGALQFWPYAGQTIDDYLITARDLYWAKFDCNLDGDLYWNVNGYCDWGSGNVVGYGRVADLYTTSCRDGVSDGDGFYFYPGSAYGSETPFPSLRLLAIRDGIDDHDYLSLLEAKSIALAEKYGVSANSVSDAIKTINEAVYATGTSKLNFNGLIDVRRSIARLIELADSNAGLVLTSLETNEDGVSYSFVSKNGVEVKVNGKTLEASDEASDGTVYSQKNGVYDERGLLTIEASDILTEIYIGNAPEVYLDLGVNNNLQQLKVHTNYGSSVKENNQTIGGRKFDKAQIDLSGYKFDSDISTQSYAPSVHFGVDDIENMGSISFWIYNAGEELEVNITAGTEMGMNYPLDTIVLPANEWKRIEIANFNRISTSQETLSDISEIRLSTANLLDVNGRPYQHKIYMGSVYCQMK